ncbi:MAG: glycosyltransferase family 25 protein [Pirellulales bacterium]
MFSGFERAYVVTLARRPDRYQRFVDELPADWPFPQPEKFTAVDGQQVKPPRWWRQGDGAWGCYRSHVAILERCINDGVESVLLLEDDAVFGADFAARVAAFIEALPDDWQMIYLGGQLLQTQSHRPGRINDLVYRPYNVNRTHAYGVRGREFLVELYKHLHDWQDWKHGHHIDHHLGRMHQIRKHHVYCPHAWLVGQAEGNSDIKQQNQHFGERFWPAPAACSGAELTAAPKPFVAVVGLHSSGSSALAGMLYHLGAHLGSRLGGFYGNDPERSCGFEAARLAQICEAAIPFPRCQMVQPTPIVTGALRGWTSILCREAARLGTRAVGKYPMFCQLGFELRRACPGLQVIHIDRRIRESIDSLIRRCPKRDPAALEAHQRWLWQGKLELLGETLFDQVLHVTYDELLADPSAVAIKALDFMGLRGTPEALGKAVAYVDAGRRHVGGPIDTQTAEKNFGAAV